MEQLTMGFVLPTALEGAAGTYTRYGIHQFLDGQKGKTALVVYADACMALSLPVEMGRIHVTAVTRTDGLAIGSLRAEQSRIDLSGLLTTLCVEGNELRAVYEKTIFVADEVGKKPVPPIQLTMPGTTVIYLHDLIPIAHRKAQRLTGEFTPEALVGKVVQVEVRIQEDWIRQVISTPFVVSACSLENNHLRIEGADGIMLDYSHVVGIRHNGNYTIVDIRDPEGRMNRSFDIWHAPAGQYR